MSSLSVVSHINLVHFLTLLYLDFSVNKFNFWLDGKQFKFYLVLEKKELKLITHTNFFGEGLILGK